MCKAPKPPPPVKPDIPEFLHNPFLDAAFGKRGTVEQLRAGRSSLRIRRGGPDPQLGTSPVQNPLGVTLPPNILPATLAPVGLPGLQGINFQRP